MILIISTCREKLSEYEFVNPIKRIAEKYGKVEIIRYDRVDKNVVKKYDRIIISSTVMKDFDYLNFIENFEWLKETDIPVIGICAGMQIISVVFDNKLKEKEIIGVKNVKIVKETKLSKKGEIRAYFVTSKIPESKNNIEVLGLLENENVFFKIKNKEIYGTAFHPEVLNKDILQNFLSK